MKSLTRLLRPLRGTAASAAPRRDAGGARPTLEALEDRLVLSTSIISSNFNGTPIAAGDTVWFSSVAKVSGVPSAGATLSITNASIDFTANGTPYHLAVPNATIHISPAATAATTLFDGSTWVTTVPTNLGGNVFLAGLALPAPAGLPGGIKPVTWQADFSSDTPGLTVNWQWAAAAYSTFGTDYNALNVKPVDSNQASAYKNSDHAGTPEAFRQYVLGGARGGGGSNYTGSYSATGQVQPGMTPASASASLSGSVVDDSGAGLSEVTITLSWTNNLGQPVSVTTVTDVNGNYSFTGLQAGTYSITQTPPWGYTDSNNSFASIVLTAGANDTGYSFVDSLPTS